MRGGVLRVAVTASLSGGEIVGGRAEACRCGRLRRGPDGSPRRSNVLSVRCRSPCVGGTAGRRVAPAPQPSAPYANMCSYAPRYVELHCHSAFSFLDGASLPEELVAAALERGHGALALTDHDTVSGSMEFAQAAQALGLRAIHGAEVDASSRRAASHLTLLVRDADRLAQPLPAAHARARAHARDGRPQRDRSRAGGRALDDVEAHARGARLPVSGCARSGVRDEPTMRRLLGAFGRDALPRRAAAAVRRATTARCNRGLAALAARLGVAVRRDRQRPRAHARARAAAGRVRRDPRAHDARRLRAAAPRQPRHVLATPAGDGRPLRRPPRGGRRDRAAGRDADLRPHAATSATATPAPRTRRRPQARARSARRASTSATRTAASTAPRRRRAWRRSCASSPSSGCRASSCCTTTCSSSRARSPSRSGGADSARALLPPGRGRGLERLLDRLLPHRPLARRPDRQRAAARALPQRGDHLAAGHRPRLPARRPRGADPARARALRPRALGARRGVPDVPRARRDPRARQGARPAAGRDRARRARQRGLVVARRRPRHRRLRSGPDRRSRPLGLARAPGRRGLRPAAPPLPALGRDDRRDPAARRLLSRSCPPRWRAARWSSGTRTPARTRAF